MPIDRLLFPKKPVTFKSKGNEPALDHYNIEFRWINDRILVNTSVNLCIYYSFFYTTKNTSGNTYIINLLVCEVFLGKLMQEVILKDEAENELEWLRLILLDKQMTSKT